MKPSDFDVGESASSAGLPWHVISWVVCAAVLVCCIAYAFWPNKGAIERDRLCPATGPAGQVVLLVDKTDPLTFTQKQAFEVLLNKLVSEQVPMGYLLSVFVLGGDYKSNPKPIFNKCNPGDGTDANAFTNNVTHLRKRFEDKFRQPVLGLADKLQTPTSERYSPIFEMLSMTAINGFRAENVKGPRRLIIVSDMLHNTPEYSMYRGTPDFQSFVDSDYGRKMHTDLKDVEIQIQYLMNTPHLQTRRNLKFWEDYFNWTGARVVEAKTLEG
jgi:hypothetical protein